jgi:CRISPR-associated protein Csb1
MTQAPSSSVLTLEKLRETVTKGAVAIRRIQRLQPAGGPGDKVFPPTYEGGIYATEQRIINGQRVPCVLLDSVQSQANRMELALKQKCYRGKDQEADIPVVTVDFTAAELKNKLEEIGEVTSLDAPHRLADAILRDSNNKGVAFRDSEEGKLLNTATVANATGLYSICPTALVLGIWDSTGPRGGMGTKFQRAMVSEIIGVNAEKGVKTSSRLDPFNIPSNIVIYNSADPTLCEWTLDENIAAKDSKGKPILFDRGRGEGKAGTAAKANHGNIPPSIVADKGGTTFDYAQQSVVISLPALRRLRFPNEKKESQQSRDEVAQAALVALAIAAAHLSIAQGCDLRSRCLLIPDVDQPAMWEIIGSDGQSQTVTIPDPVALMNEAAAAGVKIGLPVWKRKPLVLTPSEGLVALIKKSRDLAADESVEG